MGALFSACGGKPGSNAGPSEASESYKVVMIGDGGVGKSAITIQFIQGRFEEQYDPTIEDTYQKVTEIDARPVCLNVVDTAGQEDYLAMREAWLRHGDAFVLVFSLTDLHTYQELRRVIDQITEAKDTTKVPLVLVGNKKDLVDQRVVQANTASSFSTSVGATYIETSAKTGENIDKVFQEVVRQCRTKLARAAQAQPPRR